MMLLLVLASVLCSTQVFCYYASETHFGGHCEHIEVHHRVLCEGYQITEGECLTRGCCWDETNSPRCYMGNIAYKKSGKAQTSYHGALYPLSNALDGIDPTGLDPRNCAFVNASSSEYVEIYLGGRYFLHAITLHNKEGTIHDLFIKTQVDNREWTMCGRVGNPELPEWVHTECAVPTLVDTIRIQRDFTYNYGPLYLCQIYASGVDYEPTCSVVPLKTRIQCGSHGVTRDECLASSCCYNSTSSPACFQSNIAYGKTLFPHYKDNYQTMTDGVFYDDIDKSFMIYKSSLENITLTVDLEKTTSISSVIIHILSMSHTPAPTSVFVSQDGDSTSSSAKYCGTTSVPKKSDLIFVRCSKPLTGRYVTLSFMFRHYTYVKEIVITGGSTTATTFGSATLNNRGGVNRKYDEVIMIPDRTESFQAPLGTVTGWKVSAQRSKPVHLAFWRPSGHGQYNYVGGTDYTPPGNGVHEIKLTADQQFEIQQGDVVGIEWRQGGAIRFTNIQPCRANNVKHLIHTHPSPTHSKTTPVYFSESNTCGPYQILAQVNQ